MAGGYDPGYTQPERAASQRELDMLHQQVQSMDAATRVIGTMQLQITDLIKDMADSRADTREWRADHVEAHRAEVQARLVTRRWLWGIAAAYLGSTAAILAMLQSVLAHVH